MKYTDVPILMYHDVGLSTTPWCVSETSFKAQMMLLKRKGYRTISLDELQEGLTKEGGEYEISGKAVVITFDDARKGVYSIAYPLLRELGFTATIYIVPRWVEGEEIPREELYSGFLNWNQLRDLALAGWGMGSHSLRHQDLTSITTEQLMKELQEADGMIVSIFVIRMGSMMRRCWWSLIRTILLRLLRRKDLGGRLADLDGSGCCRIHQLRCLSGCCTNRGFLLLLL